MSMCPDALKECKVKAINSFKINSKPLSIKACHLKQKLIPDVYGKKYSRKNRLLQAISSCSRGVQLRLAELEMVFL